MNHSKYRVFLKTCFGKFKKIYSIEKIRSKNKEQCYFLVKIWSSIMCTELGLPSKSEIHYHYPSNGKDSHLSVKYIDAGPFSDHSISFVENYLTIRFGGETYKHKQKEGFFFCDPKVLNVIPVAPKTVFHRLSYKSRLGQASRDNLCG